MMDARPAEVHDLTVDPQTPSRVELQRADAEGRLVRVHLDVVTVAQDDPTRVERRGVDAPTRWVAHGQPPPNGRRLPREAGEGRHLGRDHHTAAVDDLGLHRRGLRHRTVVLEHRCHLDDGDLVVELACGHPQAVEREVQEIAHHQLHVPVDPGARVPASIVLRGHLDPDLVVIAVTNEMIDRQRETGIAVRVMPGEAPVHPHGRVAVHALELDEHPLPAIVSGDEEGLLVLPRTTGEVRVSRTLRWATRRIDHRVVRQPHRQPRRHLAPEFQERTDLRSDAPAVVERRALQRLPLTVGEATIAASRVSRSPVADRLALRPTRVPQPLPEVIDRVAIERHLEGHEVRFGHPILPCSSPRTTQTTPSRRNVSWSVSAAARRGMWISTTARELIRVITHRK